MKKYRFYPVFGVIKNRVGVKKHPIFCNGKHPYCSKNCHKLCLWTCLKYYIKYFQICTNYSRKILGGFYLPQYCTGFLLPQINLKETSGLFLPRDGQICGVKKPPFFHNKKYPQFLIFNMLNTCFLNV